MKTIKASLEDLIETTIDIIVEHYVDSYANGMGQYNHRHIVDKNIENMKSDLTTKLIAILKDKSE